MSKRLPMTTRPNQLPPTQQTPRPANQAHNLPLLPHPHQPQKHYRPVRPSSPFRPSPPHPNPTNIHNLSKPVAQATTTPSTAITTKTSHPSDSTSITSPTPSLPSQISQSLASRTATLSPKATIGFSVGLGVAFFLIMSGIVSLVYHRRHEHHGMGAHVPVVVDTGLSPEATKYGMMMMMMHVDDRGQRGEGNGAVYELESPDGEKRSGRVERSGERRY